MFVYKMPNWSLLNSCKVTSLTFHMIFVWKRLGFSLQGCPFYTTHWKNKRLGCALRTLQASFQATLSLTYTAKWDRHSAVLFCIFQHSESLLYALKLTSFAINCWNYSLSNTCCVLAQSGNFLFVFSYRLYVYCLNATVCRTLI